MRDRNALVRLTFPSGIRWAYPHCGPCGDLTEDRIEVLGKLNVDDGDALGHRVIQGSSLLYPAHQVAASTTLEAFFDGRVFCEFSRWIYGDRIQLDKGFQRRIPDIPHGPTSEVNRLFPTCHCAHAICILNTKQILAVSMINWSHKMPVTVDAKDNSAIELTTNVISAYVSNNPVPISELPALIAQVHKSLVALSGAFAAPGKEAQKPAVNPKRSVHDDYIICLEDGKKFKSLKRHLSTGYGMTPEQYRKKWKLADDYPMVAPAYAAARSSYAKKMGFGRKPKAVQAEIPASKKRTLRKAVA